MKTPIIIATVLGAAIANAQPGASVDQDGNGVADEDDLTGGTEAKAMLPVKLEDIILVAVRLSPDLARARIDRTTAFHTAAAARHTLAWNLTFNAGGNMNGTGDQVEVPVGGVVEQDTLSAAVGLGTNFSTGGSFSINAGVQHQHTQYSLVDTILTSSAASMSSVGSGATSTSNLPQNEDAYNVQTSTGITFKQPLGRGFGSVAIAEIRKADLNATQATLKAQLAAEDLIKDLVSSYWELAYSSYEVDVRTEALELAKRQSDLTHEQMRAGAAQPSALGAVTYELMTREDNMLQAKTDMEKKSMDLRQKSGLQLRQRDIVLHPSEDFTIGDDEFDVGEVLEKSRTSNRKLATIAIEEKLADVDVEVAADSAKPQVDLQLQGAILGNGDSVGTSFDSTGSFGGFQVSASLNMSFELSGAARRAKDAALAKRRRITVDRVDTIRQVESQTTLAVKAVATARARVTLEKQAIEVAEENVRAERVNFIGGKADNFKVLQRQTELTDARLKFGRAVADYHIAIATLQYLSGYLLEQYGVDVRTHQRG
ncbi:MAG TPA: TolC family protein [Kofleriaceae bacterium]|nr:TolC family protein [Kofleriaceae bacterium]